MRHLFLAVIVAALPACGVPLQSSPEALGPGIGPEAPLEVPTADGTADGAVYMVDGEMLVAVARGTTTEPADTLQQLLAGPTAQEEAAGLRTAIPASSVVRQVSVAEGVATVDVSPEFAGVGGQEEIMAIAQLVLTLTARGVERVTIHLEGLPVALPLPNGVLVTDPVGFDDYQVLIDR